MSKLKFENNFTTYEQSKRLLEMDVPADSTDCILLRYKGTFYETELRPRYELAQGDAIVKAIDLIKKQKIKDANVVPSI